MEQVTPAPSPVIELGHQATVLAPASAQVRALGGTLRIPQGSSRSGAEALAATPFPVAVQPGAVARPCRGGDRSSDAVRLSRQRGVAAQQAVLGLPRRRPRLAGPTPERAAALGPRGDPRAGVARRDGSLIVVFSFFGALAHRRGPVARDAAPGGMGDACPIPSAPPSLHVASKVIPGGVNSPVRAFRAVGGAPVFISRCRGRLPPWGRRTAVILDFVGSWGPMILGHAHPDVVAATCAMPLSAARATGAPTELEVVFAETLCALYPSMDMGARRLERHRGDDERSPRCARLHRPRCRGEVRRLLPRPRRLPAREERQAAGRQPWGYPTPPGCPRPLRQQP